MLSIPN